MCVTPYSFLNPPLDSSFFFGIKAENGLPLLSIELSSFSISCSQYFFVPAQPPRNTIVATISDTVFPRDYDRSLKLSPVLFWAAEIRIYEVKSAA